MAVAYCSYFSIISKPLNEKGVTRRVQPLRRGPKCCCMRSKSRRLAQFKKSFQFTCDSCFQAATMSIDRLSPTLRTFAFHPDQHFKSILSYANTSRLNQTIKTSLPNNIPYCMGKHHIRHAKICYWCHLFVDMGIYTQSINKILHKPYMVTYPCVRISCADNQIYIPND